MSFPAAAATTPLPWEGDGESDVPATSSEDHHPSGREFVDLSVNCDTTGDDGDACIGEFPIETRFLACDRRGDVLERNER